MAKLRKSAAAGDADAADKLAALERQRDLEKEIAAIKATGFQEATKEVLIREATARSQLEDPDANKKASQKNAAIAEEKKKAEEQKKIALKVAAEKLNKEALLESKLQSEIAALRKDADSGDVVAKDKVAALERARDLEKEIARIRASALQDTTKEQLIREATARSLLADPNANLKASQKATAATRETQLSAQRTIDERLEVKELRAAGKDKKADELQKRFDLRDRTAEIVSQTGVTPQTAAVFAQREQDANDAIERRSEGRRKILGGISSNKFEGLAGRQFPGLNSLSALQLTNPDGSRVIPIGKAFARQNASNARAQQQRENKMVPEAGQMLSTLQAIEKHLSNVN